MLQVKNVSKVYEGKMSYLALTDINLDIEKGEFVGVMGPSGSGKTTLLNLIATIDEPTTGNVFIEGDDPYLLKQNALAKFRSEEHTSELQSRGHLVCRLLLEKKNKKTNMT